MEIKCIVIIKWKGSSLYTFILELSFHSLFVYVCLVNYSYINHVLVKITFFIRSIFILVCVEFCLRHHFLCTHIISSNTYTRFTHASSRILHLLFHSRSVLSQLNIYTWKSIAVCFWAWLFCSAHNFLRETGVRNLGWMSSVFRLRIGLFVLKEKFIRQILR